MKKFYKIYTLCKGTEEVQNTTRVRTFIWTQPERTPALILTMVYWKISIGLPQQLVPTCQHAREDRASVLRIMSNASLKTTLLKNLHGFSSAREQGRKYPLRSGREPQPSKTPIVAPVPHRSCAQTRNLPQLSEQRILSSSEAQTGRPGEKQCAKTTAINCLITSSTCSQSARCWTRKAGALHRQHSTAIGRAHPTPFCDLLDEPDERHSFLPSRAAIEEGHLHAEQVKRNRILLWSRAWFRHNHADTLTF
jgi:hypothetical protein